MPTDQENIVHAVECSLESFVELFRQEPTRFFTENDLVCELHRRLFNSLDVLKLATVHDKDGFPVNVVHCEYPTPFRCDMKGGGFRMKRDDERTESSGKFRRGHFDIVVFNPDSIRRHSYSAIKGQNYGEFLKFVIPDLNESQSMILVGVEIVFRRDPIPPSKANSGAMAFVANVLQDMDKLDASVGTPGFMQRAEMLAFIRGSSMNVIEIVKSGLAHVPNVRLAYPSGK